MHYLVYLCPHLIWLLSFLSPPSIPSSSLQSTSSLRGQFRIMSTLYSGIRKQVCIVSVENNYVCKRSIKLSETMNSMVEINFSFIVYFLQGVSKKLDFMISALYGFSCPMWAFRGLLDTLGGSYIKIKICQVISKAFQIFLHDVDP